MILDEMVSDGSCEGEKRMSKEKGYSRLRCDRCNKEIYAKDDSVSAGAWATIKRYTADGTLQEYLVCPSCKAACRKFADKEDNNFLDFMISNTEEV